MKNYQMVFLFTGLLFCAACSAYAQQTQFQKVYTFFDGGAIPTFITEDGGGYIIVGYESESINPSGPSGYFFLKTDTKGKIVWYKNLQRNKTVTAIKTFGRFLSSVARAKDKGFFIVEKDSGNKGSILLKTDSTGNLLWEKNLDESITSGTGYPVESIDGSLYTVNYVFGRTIIIKTDNAGNILWNKNFTLGPSAYNGVVLKEFSDKSLILSGLNKIIRMDKDGNITGEQTFSSGIYAMIMDDDYNVIISTSNQFEKLDKDGNQLWTVNTGSYIVQYISPNADGEYAVIESGADSTYLSKYNKDTGLRRRKPVRENSWNLSQTSDGGFLTSDYFYQTRYYPVITKTDENGDIYSVSIVFPFKAVNATSSYNIYWLKNNVENIDIDFSSDNGLTWGKAAESLSAGASPYLWNVPIEVSNKCLLRISDSDNSAIYDQSDSVFTVIPPYYADEYIAANDIKMWIGNNGDGSHSPLTDGQGLFWPGGEDATQGAVFEDGLVFGGKVNGEIRVGGSTYRHGLRPGNVLSDTAAADPEDVRFQVWKIKKNTSMLSDSEKAKYNYEYENWPVDLGAPWVDKNLDGVYTQGIDYPKFYGEETLFNVMNDFDSTTTKFLYGSDPMGLEIQCLTYGIDTTNGLKDAVFKQYKLINKSSNEITDMYLSYWTDDDMGDAHDDYVGVDTSLNLGYTWNSQNNDDIYGSPPALGHMIIQGPILPSSESDSARFDNGWRHGYKNLPATALAPHFCGSGLYIDPDLGRYDGTLQTYNNMKGLLWDGSECVDPITGKSTTFPLSGDPVTGTGWYEGDGWPGGPSLCDENYILSSGPFNLAPGDTQEITIAIFMALGSDNIQSITALRDKAAFIQEFYNNDLLREINPPITPIENFRLEQNYPNPFNSITNIEYTLPVKSRVTIKIYDILGREVKTIHQGEQVPWQYRVSFNASAFASGVYIYRIEAVPVSGQGGPSTGSGQEFIQTKKMVLIK